MTKTYLTLILFSFFSCNINYCQEKGIFYGTSIKNLFNFKKISSFSLKESSFFYAAKRGYDFFKRASFNQKKLGLLTSGLLWCGYKITKPYLKFYGRYFLIPLVYGCNDTLAKKYFNSLYTIDGKPSFLNIANICLQTKYNPPELDNQNLFNIESIIDWYHDSKKNTYEKNLKILQSALFLKNKYINKLSDKEKKEFDLAYCNTHDFFEKNEELKKRYEAICENNQEDMYEVYKKNIENEYNEISKNIEYKKKDLTFHFQEISKIINRIKQNQSPEKISIETQIYTEQIYNLKDKIDFCWNRMHNHYHPSKKSDYQKWLQNVYEVYKENDGLLIKIFFDKEEKILLEKLHSLINQAEKILASSTIENHCKHVSLWKLYTLYNKKDSLKKNISFNTWILEHSLGIWMPELLSDLEKRNVYFIFQSYIKYRNTITDAHYTLQEYLLDHYDDNNNHKDFYEKFYTPFKGIIEDFKKLHSLTAHDIQKMDHIFALQDILEKKEFNEYFYNIEDQSKNLIKEICNSFLKNTKNKDPLSYCFNTLDKEIHRYISIRNFSHLLFEFYYYIEEFFDYKNPASVSYNDWTHLLFDLEMLYHDMITGNKNISQENIKNIEATISKYKVNNKNIPYLKEPLYHLRPLVTRVIHYNEEQKNIWLMYFHKIIHKSKSIEKLWKEEVEEKQFPNSIDGKKLLERIKENANSQSEESERFKILFSKSMPTLFEKIDMIALFQIIAYNKDEKSTNENTRFKNLFQPIPDSPSKKNLEAIVKKKRKSVS